MKKVIVVFLTLFFVITNNVMANSVVKIDELYMTIIMPPDYTFFTRDMADSSEAMKALKTDKREFNFMMMEKESYLIALDSKRTLEFTVGTEKSNDKLAKTIQDLNLFENRQIENKMPELLEALRNAGKNPINNYIYTVNKAKYIVIDYWRKDKEGTKVYSRNYNTVKNGKMVVISFMRRDGKEITKEDADSFKIIVDNIVFEEKLTKRKQAYTGRMLMLLGVGLIAFISAFIFIIKRLKSVGRN
ncbi:MAG: hypothetical protein EOL98_02460 [Negativicutes bacterium]|nr:hypothetical protein [Negativicutes bacterium]